MKAQLLNEFLVEQSLMEELFPNETAHFGHVV